MKQKKRIISMLLVAMLMFSALCTNTTIQAYAADVEPENEASNYYCVVYDGNGATSGYMEDQTLESGVLYHLKKNEYEKEGYEFRGWSENAEGEGTIYEDEGEICNLISPEFEQIVLYAQWDRKVNIAYILDGGINSEENPSTYISKDEGYIELKNPSKAGYSFEGWYMDLEDLESEVKQISLASTDDVKVYARWERIAYLVSYEMNGGENVETNPSEIKLNNDSTELQDPIERVGYKFLGWFKDATYIESITEIPACLDEDLLLYASWQANAYTINFNGNGATSGTMSSMSDIKYGTDYMLSANTYARKGYAFKGWNTKSDGTGIAYANKENIKNLKSTDGSSITLYAQWGKNQYTITYNLNGGTNSTTNPVSFSVTTADITMASPTKKGYDFDGWYSDEAFTKRVTKIAKGSTGNKTLYAKWIAHKYTIKFNGNGATGGTMSSMTGRKYGTTYTLAANAYTRKGYAFKGWNTAADGTGTTYANKASVKNLKSTDGSSITLYAQWSKNKYTITYNLNGGTNSTTNPVSFSVTTADITLATPTKKGYDFDGWYSDEAFTKKVTKITKGSTGNKTLYAKWVAHKYTIKFNGNGATGGTMSSMTGRKYGTTYTLTANAYTRKGYAFKGWNTAADGSGTAYANKASVKNLKSTDGSSITLYAQWSKNKYTITYNLNGGTNNTTNPANYYVTTSTITLTKPTKKGYTFGGWYSDAECTKSVSQIVKGSTGNKTLYAKWSKIKYTITYNLNGGTNDATNPTSYYVTTSTISLAKPTKKGYTFGGWYSDSAYTKKVTEIVKGTTGNKTLYAKWTANKYNVVFDSNGGAGNMEPVACTYGKSYALTPNAFTRKGYAFKGWNTKADGTGTAYENQANVKNLKSSNGATITLYAKWEKKKYVITYNLDGGTNNVNNPANYYITTATISLANPTKTGYTFGGWYTDSAYTQKITEITKGTTGNRTLYAKWTANKYKIAFDANGGTGTMDTVTCTYGKSYTLGTNMYTRSGYVFAGWNTKADGTGTKYANKASVKNLKSSNGSTITLYATWTVGSVNISVKKARYNQNTVTINCVKNASGYEIYRSEKSDGDYKKIATVEESHSYITSYASEIYYDKTAVSGKKYYYKVRAYVNSGQKIYGNYSSVVSCTTALKPQFTGYLSIRKNKYSNYADLHISNKGSKTMTIGGSSITGFANVYPYSGAGYTTGYFYVGGSKCTGCTCAAGASGYLTIRLTEQRYFSDGANAAFSFIYDECSYVAVVYDDGMIAWQ